MREMSNRSCEHLPVDEGAKEQQEQDGDETKVAFAYDLFFERMINGFKRVSRIAKRFVGRQSLERRLLGHFGLDRVL